MSKIKIVIAEDSKLVADAYINILEEAGYEVVKTFQDGLSLVKWIENNFSDVIILDINMPIMDGAEVLEYFKSYNLNQNVIISSEHCSETFIDICKGFKIKGFLTKTYCDQELIKAIECVVSGKTYFSKLPILENMNTSYIKQKEIDLKLSNREKEMLPMLEHYTYDEIAKEKGLKINTVKTYFKRIREKFQVQSNIELVKKFYIYKK
ncbi:response regulator transcription factor [Tenacibaculum aiptasiae]|uniref:response regulator transcription factor n=1 Tax=Tenacibaculum aiptasiae TaxID=426481 RepID=UPI002330481D|nr:response regulator transcription factor [Tenacibaculum aiptasiae]